MSDATRTGMGLCGACRRHVRAGDARCPFCGAGVDAIGAAAAGASGLSRAAMYAVGAVLATGVAAAAASGCGDAAQGDGVQNATSSGGATDADAGQPEVYQRHRNSTVCCPPYGCVFPDEACSVIRA